EITAAATGIGAPDTFSGPLFEELDRQTSRGVPPAERVRLRQKRDQAYASRWASRYCRTTRRSATCPLSMRSRAEDPANRGAVFGRRTHSSAVSSCGSRV